MNLQIPLRSAVNGQVSAERLVNMYAEQTTGKSPVMIRSTPGLRLFSAISETVCRGLTVHNNLLYGVFGENLYFIPSDGEEQVIGEILGSGLCVFASSGIELAIACDGHAYIYDSTLTKITDEDFLGADAVEYLDGYFIFSNGTDSFQISALLDGGDIDALDFASAESSPDPIVRAFVDHRELFLFGSKTVETWVNTGGTDFPFERISGGIAERGIASVHSVARIDNTVFWLDSDGVVRRMGGGYSPQRISTHEVERTFSGIESAECSAFVVQGHEFFVLSLPDRTWVYDAATQMWHERKSHDEGGRWRARGYAYCYGKHLVGDYENGNVYELDEDVFTEAGDPLIAEIVFPPVHNESKRFRLHRITLDMEVGEVTDHSDPQIRLDLSDDGVEWFTHGYRSLGTTGKRSQRVTWNRLGQHRTLHMRFLISDPCRRAMYSAFGEVSIDQ